MVKCLEAPAVIGYTIVTVVAFKLQPKKTHESLCRQHAIRLYPFLHPLHTLPEFLPAGTSLDPELTLVAGAAVVGKA
ncbi:MAG: hypothetical protein ACPL5F_06540 [Moorellaceae bacterium]